jgi:hypothetical protein
MTESTQWLSLTEQEAKEFHDFSTHYDLTFFESLYGKGPSLLADAPRPTPIADTIIDSIKRGSPFSLVRIGDGEGNCFASLFKDYPNLANYCQRKISYIHFGDYDVVPDASTFFEEAVSSAVANADLMGVPTLRSISNGFSSSDINSIDVRAVCGNRLSAIKVHLSLQPHQKTASPWTNRELLAHYPRIMDELDHLNVISSYDEIADLLSSTLMKGKPVKNYKIPKQLVFLEKSERKNTCHYPDGMNQIRAQIPDDCRGEFFLVAGGLLGKHYCDIIKWRGGIALDIGSVPEIWQGIPNRGLSTEYVNKWKLV